MTSVSYISHQQTPRLQLGLRVVDINVCRSVEYLKATDTFPFIFNKIFMFKLFSMQTIPYFHFSF